MTELAQYVPVSEAKNRLLGLLRELEARQEAIALTRDGVPTAVLLSMEQFHGLREPIEIPSDRSTVRALRRSLKQAAQNRWVPYRDVFGK
jgi:antitoxin YefM